MHGKNTQGNSLEITLGSKSSSVASRDRVGHGTLVASTADGSEVERGTGTARAPKARIAMYATFGS